MTAVAETTHRVVGRVNDVRTTERHWAPKPSGKPDPAGHLSPEDFERIAIALDEMRQEVLDSRGEDDARYIHTVIKAQRALEVASRAILLFSGNPACWLLGTTGLSVAKILDNMEIGHNVMHGQWDWMRDPAIHSTTWEWDNVSPSVQWKHSHNQLHHTYTNVIGRDNDLGYGILRVDEDQRWSPFFLFQPLWNLINALVFEYSIALYDLEIGRVLAGKADRAEFDAKMAVVKRKIGRQALKDYVLFPLLSGPNAVSTLTANLVANLVRNVWAHGVIVCGHFPYGVETFSKASIEGETRGEWYVRQMLGSANISGGPLIHLMTGNLSHQVEHHLFPDLPSNRYAQLAPRVRELMEANGLRYVTGSLLHQYASTWVKTFEYALPNGAWRQLRQDPVGSARRAVSYLRGRRDKA